jgi:hypothetical protein
MEGDPSARLDVTKLLSAVEDAPPFSAADVLGERLASELDAREVSFLIADFSGHALIRLGHSGDTRATRIGVLELLLRKAPDEQVLAEVAFAAHALAYVVIANRRYTDLFELGQRSVPLTLAAEIQHRLLPGSYTCEGGQFTLAGWLEPAGNVGGDTFDFALERGVLHFSLTDAMGHEVAAALLATLTIAGLRNARRASVGLAEQTRVASEGLAEHAPGGGFVTGQAGP